MRAACATAAVLLPNATAVARAADQSAAIAATLPFVATAAARDQDAIAQTVAMLAHVRGTGTEATVAASAAAVESTDTADEDRERFAWRDRQRGLRAPAEPVSYFAQTFPFLAAAVSVNGD